MTQEHEKPSVASGGFAMRGAIRRCPSFGDDDKACAIGAILLGPLALVAVASALALAKAYFLDRTVDAMATVEVMAAEEIQSLRNRVNEIEKRLEK
jgi:ABC-type lipoprotein release transport system permease subunit